MSDSALSEEDDLLAAERAFGLLDASEVRAAEARADRDPVFAAACAYWDNHAAALAAGGGEEPGEALWAAIVARLPANDGGGVPVARLRRWQALTLAATAAAILLAVIGGPHIARQPPLTPAAVTPAAPLIATLTGKAGTVTISYDRANQKLLSAPNGLEVGDRAAELWVIPVGGKPRSLGVIAAATPRWQPARLPAASAIAPGATLAISLEPQGGSPTGQPTGPVVLTGSVVQA
ncbi:MAG: anti-sigma factor [Sphingomonadaceae bacterium]|nr:anti-sigma factor [Sphingomonadaceae bacterium]